MLGVAGLFRESEAHRQEHSTFIMLTANKYFILACFKMAMSGSVAVLLATDQGGF